MDSNTVHGSDGTVIRKLESGAVTYEWEVVDREKEDSLEGYEYAGDGEPSDAAVGALEDFIDEFHGDE